MMNFQQYAKLYRDELLDSVIPFWMKHSPDREYGGFFHCFDATGNVINDEKNMWPQARQIWTFSWLYNNLEKRPEWLEIANLGIDFLKKNGRDKNGDWYFCLTRQGKPTVQPYNIFSDFFAVIGFAEFAKATNDDEALKIALDTFDRIQMRRDNPKGKYNKVVTGNHSFKNLAFPMINLNVLNILNKISPNQEYEKIITNDICEVMDNFIDSDAKIIHENILQDNSFDNSSYIGRQITPGHGIEAMWFIMDLAKEREDQELIKRCCQAIKWSLDFGWDKKHGGIFYFMDKLAKPHIELQWDMKLWWVHLESLIACLKGYQLTGDPELWAWFKRIHDYTWTHFPDLDGEEWFGYLSREGVVNNHCKANRWKACFHLPRALFIISEIFNQLSTADSPQ